jgi:uncharacterized protein with ATP-grasp and redox domains
MIRPVRSHLECIPCVFQQAIRCGRLCGLDEGGVRELIDDIARAVPRFDPAVPPPVNARIVYDRLAALTGEEDPFAGAKRRHTELALELVPWLRERIADSPDPLDTAVRLAAAGNILDLGALDEPTDLEGVLRRAIGADHVRWEIDALRAALGQARSVMVVCDNAGEVVFDRVLLETVAGLLPGLELYASARGGPIINDATVDDARAAGLDAVATVVSTGSDLPGVVLDQVTDDFRRVLLGVDVVVAKGQGNFETMSEMARELFFVLTAKCQVVARHLGLTMGSSALVHHRVDDPSHP